MPSKKKYKSRKFVPASAKTAYSTVNSTINKKSTEYLIRLAKAILTKGRSF